MVDDSINNYQGTLFFLNWTKTW